MNINGSKIFVETCQGKGNLNFVLIHNAGGNHLFFIHQIEILKRYGNVIQIDLPGHGSSDAITNYEMNKLSLIVKSLCEHLSLKNICLIGLNNGANIVIDTVLNYSLPIKKIVLIDPPIFMEETFVAEINNFIEKLENADYKNFVISLVDSSFIDTNAYNKKIAENAFMNVNKKSLQNIFRGLIKWDANSAGILKNVHCPALCILTNEHHCSYKKLIQEAPHFDIAKVVGSKCWATLEAPEQVNAMIERFLKI